MARTVRIMLGAGGKTRRGRRVQVIDRNRWIAVLLAVAGIGIVASIIGTFTFFYFLGFTLNTMTLMALSLSIGMLIDDAIVVLENNYRHMEMGKPPKQAASEGTEEIGLAVFATTLSVVAVFVPIAFLSGVVGQFFREFGLTASAVVIVPFSMPVSRRRAAVAVRR